MSGHKCFQFLFGEIFISPSVINESPEGHHILNRQFISLRTWSMSLHSLLAYRISDEKSAVSIIRNPPKVIWHFSQAYFMVIPLFYCWAKARWAWYISFTVSSRESILTYSDILSAKVMDAWDYSSVATSLSLPFLPHTNTWISVALSVSIEPCTDAPWAVRVLLGSDIRHNDVPEVKLHAMPYYEVTEFPQS